VQKRAEILCRTMLRNIYISSDRANLDPGFGRGISSKLFEAPSPLSTGVLAYGPHEAFVLRVEVLKYSRSSIVLESIDREEV
jgi:hypothetical protein